MTLSFKSIRASLMLAILIALSMVSASAGPMINIQLVNGFTTVPNQGVVSPVLAGATTVTFSSTTFSGPTCAGLQASLCSAMNVTAGTPVFTSGTVETFNFGSVIYTTLGPWSVQSGPGGALVILTNGSYSATGYNDTAGTLNFTFQPPSVGGIYTLSGSGGTVPEPATAFVTLAGLGLIGVGILQRKAPASSPVAIIKQ